MIKVIQTILIVIAVFFIVNGILGLMGTEFELFNYIKEIFQSLFGE